MTSVEVYSRRLARLVRVLIWLVPVGWTVLMAVALLTGNVALPEGSRPAAELSWQSRAAVAVLGTAHVVVLEVILLTLHALLRLYAVGRVFVPEAAAAIRRLGVLLLVFVGVDAAAVALIGPALWLFEPMAEPPLYLEFQVTPFFIGLVVILLARIMAEACRMREDLDLTV